MAKEASVPFQVRFSPTTLERLRKIAADKGVSVHAEIIKRLEMSLAAEEDGQLEEVKALALAMLTASNLGLGDAMPIDWTLRQFKLAMEVLFSELKVPDETSEDQRRITLASVQKAIKELRSDRDTPLGDLGRALGMVEKQP
jgi:hypothetical protein